MYSTCTNVAKTSHAKASISDKRVETLRYLSEGPLYPISKLVHVKILGLFTHHEQT